MLLGMRCEPWQGSGILDNLMKRAMAAYVLIYMIFSAEGNGIATATAEFSSKEACEAAGSAITSNYASRYYRDIQFICAKKS